MPNYTDEEIESGINDNDSSDLSPTCAAMSIVNQRRLCQDVKEARDICKSLSKSLIEKAEKVKQYEKRFGPL